ncbi:MAG: Zn-ribbon domain-containing OB-fold protein [Haloarculaceae archaeon]
MMDRWEPRPVPETTPETEPYWRGAVAGELRLMRCRDCGGVYHYPRALCPDCASADTTWTVAEGTGALYSFSIQARRDDWPDEALPVVLAYVELDEGPRLMTNVVDCEPQSLAVGDRVAVRFVPTDDEEIAVPVFTPVED